MSVEAITWVLKDAPGLPAHAFGVLMGLANHASASGRGAYPSQATLAAYARKSVRQVRRDLADLEAAGLIREGDQRLVAHLAADERPVVWDLAVERIAPIGPDTDVRPDMDDRPDADVRPKSTTPNKTAGQKKRERTPTSGRTPTSARTSTAEGPDVHVLQTVLEPSSSKTSSSQKSERRATPKGTRIPEDFAVTDAMRQWGQENFPAVNGDRETAKFIDYWQAKAGSSAVKADWTAAWRYWIRNSADRYATDTGGGQGTNTLDVRAQQADYARNAPVTRPSAGARAIAAGAERAERMRALDEAEAAGQLTHNRYELPFPGSLR